MQMHVRPMRYRFQSLKGRLQLPGLNRRLIGVPHMAFKDGATSAAVCGGSAADGASAPVAGRLAGHRASIRVRGNGQLEGVQ